MNSNKNQKRKGFTVIEVLVVIVIIGILSTIVMLSVVRARKAAVAVKMKDDLAGFTQAVEAAATDGCAELDMTIGGPVACVSPTSATIYIQVMPDVPLGGGTYTENINGLDAVDPADYELEASGFANGETFICENGSCHCSEEEGCVSIP